MNPLQEARPDLLHLGHPAKLEVGWASDVDLLTDSIESFKEKVISLSGIQI
jgi:hypothetical protein